MKSCRRRYHCPVPGCPFNRSRRCTRSRVPPSASLCSRSCGCHFPLRRCAPGARLIGACGPRHIKQGQSSSCKPTHAASRSHGRQPLTQEAESKSAARVCRDGLKAAREARGARRGDPRCQTILLARAPARTGRPSMTKSPTGLLPSLRPAGCPGSSPGVRPRPKRRWPCRKTRRLTGNTVA